MTVKRAVLFHAFHSPFHPGEVAGFPIEAARHLVETRKVASYHDAARAPAADFDAMDRQQLVSYARSQLGLTEDPPADVTDEELRLGLRDAVEARAPAEPPSAGLDQLDAMDRVHLEAFGRAKLGLQAIDPELSDDELRAQIRALAEVNLSLPAEPGRKSGKGRG